MQFSNIDTRLEVGIISIFFRKSHESFNTVMQNEITDVRQPFEFLTYKQTHTW